MPRRRLWGVARAVTESHGSAAKEAMLLLSAAQEWVRTRVDGGAVAPGAPECCACPVCRGVATARQVRPETVTHLLEAARSVVAAVRTVNPPAAEPDLLRHAGEEHIDVGQS